jgi:hypothetical protein
MVLILWGVIMETQRMNLAIVPLCRGIGTHAIAWFKDPAGHILAVIQEK